MSELFLIGDSMMGGYGKGLDILYDCIIVVNFGEIVVIVGFNGVGKFIVMKVVFGMFNVCSGVVCLDGEDIIVLSLQDCVLKGMGFVLQVCNIFFFMMVEENFEMGVYICNDDIK